jgi:hypothetical protein
VIDFENPGLQVRVENDVKAEEFEAHCILLVVRLARLVNVG